MNGGNVLLTFQTQICAVRILCNTNEFAETYTRLCCVLPGVFSGFSLFYSICSSRLNNSIRVFFVHRNRKAPNRRALRITSRSHAATVNNNCICLSLTLLEMRSAQLE